MDPRKPLYKPSVRDEFISIYYAELDKRPALIAWVIDAYGPVALSELEDAIVADAEETKRSNEAPRTRFVKHVCVKHRLSWLARYQ